MEEGASIFNVVAANFIMLKKYDIAVKRGSFTNGIRSNKIFKHSAKILSEDIVCKNEKTCEICSKPV